MAKGCHILGGLKAKQTLSNKMEIIIKKITDFFSRPSEKNQEIKFADGEGFRCRLGFCVRTVWVSDNGFIPPRPSKREFIFVVSHNRLNDFGVMYVVSPTREINPEILGRIISIDLIEDNGVYYYTIIFEKKELPRLLEKKNWE